MKKLLTIILAVAMTLSMVACGEEAGNSDISGDGSNTAPTGINPLEVTIEETLVADEANVKVIAKDIVFDGENSYINMYYENNEKYKMFFHVRLLYINGYKTESFYYEEVQPGENVTIPVYFSYPTLEALNIGVITDIKINVIAGDRRGSNYLTDKIVTIPTSATGKITPELKFEGTTIYDLNNVKIVAGDIVERTEYYDGLPLTGVRFYAENNGPETVYLSLSKIHFNDVQVYAWSYDYNRLLPGESRIFEYVIDTDGNASTGFTKPLTSATVSFMVQDKDYNALEGVEDARIEFNQ